MNEKEIIEKLKDYDIEVDYERNVLKYGLIEVKLRTNANLVRMLAVLERLLRQIEKERTKNEQ
ncbi:MAG: hypothetical protein ACPLX7_10045 [Candidatus Kapaibacteriota bacterium]